MIKIDSMEASQMRNLTNAVNSEKCKVLLLMITEEVEKGNYNLIVGKDLLNENKKTYLRQLHYRISTTSDGKFNITWDEPTNG